MTRAERELKNCKSCRFWNAEGSRCWNFNCSAKELKAGKFLVLKSGSAFNFGTTSCPVFEIKGHQQKKYGKIYVQGIPGSIDARLEFVKLLAKRCQVSGEIFLWKDNFKGIEISEAFAIKENLDLSRLTIVEKDAA